MEPGSSAGSYWSQVRSESVERLPAPGIASVLCCKIWGSASSARSAVLALVQAGADPDLGRSPLTCSFVCDGMKTLIKSNIPLV